MLYSVHTICRLHAYAYVQKTHTHVCVCLCMCYLSREVGKSTLKEMSVF